MPFDSLVMSAVSEELSSLAGARVFKVYQPSDFTLVIHLRGSNGQASLIASASPSSPRVHLTSTDMPNPRTPPMFCMLARKHLEGARFAGTYQPPFERVLHLKFDGRNPLGGPESFTLVAEVMGPRSNLILLDGNGTIIDAIKRVANDSSGAREVLPGRRYTPPPERQGIPPSDITADHIEAWLSEPELRGIALEDILVRKVRGLSPALARHCALSFASRSFDLSGLADFIRASFDPAARPPYSPTVYVRGRDPVDVYCYPLLQYSSETSIRFESICEALDGFYSARVEQERFASLQRSLLTTVRKHVERAARRYEAQRRDLTEGLRAEEYRIYGELLLAYGGSVPGRATEVRLPNYYQDGCPEIVIPLDPSLSPSENAQIYFRRYAKAKAARELATKRMDESEKELRYLDQVGQMIEQALSVHDLIAIREELASLGYIKIDDARTRRSRNDARDDASAPSQPMSFKSSEGLEILVGRNNRQNDHLTMKVARPGDLWFHAKDCPGSHVILRNQGKWTPPEGPPTRSLEEAAGLAAYFSRARNSTKAQVDFTPVENVWKPKGSRPGMVLYRLQRTLTVRPLSPDELERSLKVEG